MERGVRSSICLLSQLLLGTKDPGDQLVFPGFPESNCTDPGYQHSVLQVANKELSLPSPRLA